MLAKIIDIFTQLAEINRQLGEKFKTRAYQNAIASLKRLPTNAKFFSCDELLKKYDVPGINIKGSLCQKIDEIINTNSLKELNDLLQRPDIKIYHDLLLVHDIGIKLAKKLIKDYKVTSISHLHDLVKKGKITLTHNQTLGLIHYDDLNQRIPYSEITKTMLRIKKALNIFSNEITLVPAGSYRRNIISKGTSGDIDLLIFYKKNTAATLEKCVDILTKKGILFPEFFSKGDTKFQGLINNRSGAVRQIDIRYIPLESYAPAILYFTGSKNFNQTMRQKAMRLGYKLSEYTLTHLSTGKNIDVKTEKDVFKQLKMKYVPPHLRD
jgi:DNA polymerase/3'-5' exonuclease PolX